MKFDNFILDMDGTIWDSATAAAAGFDKALKKYYRKDKVVTPQDIRDTFGKTLRELAVIIMPDIPPQEAADIVEKYCVEHQYAEMASNIPGILYPGVPETLRCLSAKHGVYIVSNCLDGYIDMLFQHTDLKQYVRDTAWYMKPADNKADNIKHIIDRYDLKNVAYVGDIEGDYIAAAAAGAEFIHATYGYGRVPQAKYHIDSFDQLLQFAAE